MLAAPAGWGPGDHSVGGSEVVRPLHKLWHHSGCPLQPGAVHRLEGGGPFGEPLAAVRPAVPGSTLGAPRHGRPDAPRPPRFLHSFLDTGSFSETPDGSLVEEVGGGGATASDVFLDLTVALQRISPVKFGRGLRGQRNYNFAL